MKIIDIFCIFGLGWMVVSFVFIFSGFYFEDRNFSGPLIIKVVEASQANLELIDQYRRFQETVSSLAF